MDIAFGSGILKNGPGFPDGVAAGRRFRLKITTVEMPYRPRPLDMAKILRMWWRWGWGGPPRDSLSRIWKCS